MGSAAEIRLPSPGFGVQGKKRIRKKQSMPEPVKADRGFGQEQCTVQYEAKAKQR